MKLKRFAPTRVRPGMAPELATSRNLEGLESILSGYADAIEATADNLAKVKKKQDQSIPPAIIGRGQVWDIRAFPSLDSAIAAFGSDAVTLYITKEVAITANLTVPENISIVRLEGGGFTSSNASTLTIEGPFSSPLSRAFFGDLVVVMDFAPFVSPEWWHDGSSNWRPAIISAYTTGAPVKLGKRTYTCDFTAGNFRLPSDAYIYGEGFNSVIESTSADARPFQNVNRTGPGLTDENITLHNFRIKNNAAGASGGPSSEFSSCFDLRYVKGLSVTQMWLQDSAGDAGTLRGNEDVFVQNIRCKDNGRQGIAVTLGKRITLDSIYGEDVALSVVDIEPNAGDTIEGINISNIYDLGGVGNGALNVFSDTDDSILDIHVSNVDCGREFICKRVLRGSFRNLTVNHGTLSDAAAFVFANNKQIELWGLRNRGLNLDGAKCKISECEGVQGGDFYLPGPGSGANGHVLEILGCRDVHLVNISLPDCNTQGMWARNNTNVLVNGLWVDGATQYAVLLNPTTANDGLRLINYVPTNVSGDGVRLDQSGGSNLNIYLDGDFSGASTPISVGVTGTITWSPGSAVPSAHRFENVYLPTGGMFGADTADGSDDAVVAFGASRTFDVIRSSFIRSYGNEHATDPGRLEFNVGDVAGANFRFNMRDNQGSAFVIREAGNNYIVLDTTDASELIQLLKAVTCALGINVAAGQTYKVNNAQVLAGQIAGLGATLASATAGAAYTGTEQAMLQEAHDKIRVLEGMLKTHGLVAT